MPETTLRALSGKDSVMSDKDMIEIGDRVRVEFWRGKNDICGDVVYLPMQIGDSWIIRTEDRLFYIQNFAAISKRIDSHAKD